MPRKITIFGERCSGTNYLQDVVTANFNVEVTWDYGWKHFFGFLDNHLENAGDTLFLLIVRDPVAWMNSLFRNPHHLNYECTESVYHFLNTEIYSLPEDWCCQGYYGRRYKTLGEDRNMYTGKRYKNIFEMRHTKLKFLIEDMPKKVKNSIFIRYEDLVNDFENTMNKIREKGLIVKDESTFPVNSRKYKGEFGTVFNPSENDDIIPRNSILENPNFIEEYEKKLGYV